MQTTLDSLLSKKYLIASLLAIALVNLGVNLVFRDLATIVGNLTIIPITFAFFIISILTAKRYGLTGNHGFAWLSFSGCATSWFIAEMIWVYEELQIRENPYPSVADIFFVMGYPLLLLFFVAYLHPFKQALPKKTLLIPLAISAGILIPSLYFVFANGTNESGLELAIGVFYPIFDAIIIVPAILGVTLFFKGQVNFMWTLICLGIICSFVADTAFLFGQNTDTYYTGNPMDILFSWNYTLLAFGAYYHLTQFKKRDNTT